MNSSADSTASPDPRGSVKELSAVLGRIIDQLSLSAWMPGLALVGGLALLVALHGSAADEFPNLEKALGSLAGLSLGGAIALLVAVILATVVAQAFEFEMIKLLEGYWGVSTFACRLRGQRTRAFSKRLGDLRDQKRRLEKAATRSAIDRMAPTDRQLTREVKRLWRARRANAEPNVAPSPAATYLLDNWVRAAKPSDLRALEACETAIGWYPSEHRLLPTRLGNTLRSAEDRMQLSDGGDLEGFVLRNYETIPDRLLAQLSAFRTRLDMYCSLVLACTILSVLAVPLTLRFQGAQHLTTIVCTAVPLALAGISYRAAVASARGYVSSLIASDQEVTRVLSTRALAREAQMDVPDTDQA